MAKNSFLVNTETKRKRSQYISRACNHCKLAHAKCSLGRPCTRCISMGKENECMDSERKKRRRRQKYDGEFEDLSSFLPLLKCLPKWDPEDPRMKPYEEDEKYAEMNETLESETRDDSNTSDESNDDNMSDRNNHNTFYNIESQVHTPMEPSPSDIYYNSSYKMDSSHQMTYTNSKDIENLFSDDFTIQPNLISGESGSPLPRSIFFPDGNDLPEKNMDCHMESHSLNIDSPHPLNIESSDALNSLNHMNNDNNISDITQIDEKKDSQNCTNLNEECNPECCKEEYNPEYVKEFVATIMRQREEIARMRDTVSYLQGMIASYALITNQTGNISSPTVCPDFEW